MNQCPFTPTQLGRKTYKTICSMFCLVCKTLRSKSAQKKRRLNEKRISLWKVWGPDREKHREKVVTLSRSQNNTLCLGCMSRYKIHWLTMHLSPGLYDASIAAEKMYPIRSIERFTSHAKSKLLVVMHKYYKWLMVQGRLLARKWLISQQAKKIDRIFYCIV